MGMALVSLDGAWLQVNRTLCEIVGYSESELLATTLQAITHPDHLNADLNCMHQLLSGKIPCYHIETRYSHKFGHLVWILLSVSLVRSTNGLPLYFLAHIQDITNRKQTELALQESEERHRRLVELSPETIAVYSQGKFVYINPAGIRLLGASSLEAIIDKPILEIVHPKYRQTFERQIKQVQAAKRAVELPALKLVQLSGQVIDVEMNASSILYKGKPAVQVVLRDITERLEIERMKDEFISVISHELRTPLTSIRGSLGLLASGLLLAQPEKSQRMLEIAVSNTDRLIRLINEILDLDRISSGTENMEKQACNAADLMQQAVDEMQSMAEKNTITLCFSPLKALLWADRDRIIQVLTNLLSNAIKFSSPGTKVWLTAQKQGQEVVFQVTDQGRGIPADKIESIFERFQQVDASDSRQKGGTGLGLAISRHIVQQHSGRIWVSSIVNQGSSFYFTLPLLQKILR